MRLSTKDGELMLPKGFSFEIERHNPFFSKEGTASVPVTIPASPEMRARLGHPDRINRSRRYVRKIPAFLHHQTFGKRCSLIVDSYQDGEGITASVAFEESRMYSELQDKDIKEIFKDETYTFPGADTPAAIAAELYERYSSEETPPEKDIIAFPVAMELQDDGSFFIANEPDNNPGSFICGRRTIEVDGKTEDVPEGYGVIPFIYLNHFLKKLFSLCGYDLIRNDYADTLFEDIVILNNCTDALCGQKAIRYRDLVPSITFGDLVEWLKEKFCAAVFVRNTEITITGFENIRSSAPDADLSGFVRDGYDISYPDEKSLMLECNTSIDGAKPAFDTMEELVRKTRALSPDADRVPYGDKWYLPFTGQILERTTESGPDGETVSGTKDLGSDCIPFGSSSSKANDSHSAVDEFVPQLSIYNTGFPSDRLPRHRSVPYIGSRTNNHTVLASEGEADPEPAEQKLMICYCLCGDMFYRGGNSHPYDAQEHHRYYMSYHGDRKYPTQLPALTPSGLYNACWRQYDTLIVNCAPTVSIKPDLPASLLLSMDLSVPKIFKGQKALVVSYTIELSESGIRCTEMSLQLLPDYEDSVTTGGFAAIPDGYVLVWRLYAEEHSTDDPGYRDLYPAYRDSDEPSYSPTYEGEIALRRTNRTYTFEGNEFGPPEYEVWDEYFIAVLEPVR